VTGDEDIKELERHVAQLGERFDSIRIIVSRQQDGETITVSSGAGNFYAQLGAVRDWLIRQDAKSQEHARQEMDEK
jgi:hypothetical protein